MPLVKGINRQVILQQETTFGTLPATSGGQLLRRVNSTLQLTKDVYQSQEILPSQQVRDSRHGVRRATGSVDGQLSPGTYKSLFEGLLRSTFTAGVSTGTQTNITAAGGPPGTFTRGAGNFLTDGFKVGDVVTVSGFTGGASANNARNYRIADLTTTVMTVSGLGNETVVAKAAGDSVNISVIGKKLFTPATGQVVPSYTIESWYPDATTPFSERYTGMRVSQISISLPASGMVGFSCQMTGQNMSVGTARYFTNPASVTSTNSLAAVNGTVRFAGADVATITGGQISISSTMEANPVVGSNIVPEIFAGRLTAQGSLSIYVQDASVYTLFSNETEVDLVFYLTADGTVNSPFIAVVMNRVKINSANKNDSDRSIIQQVAFQALENVNGGAGTKYDQTTITIQDSAA